MKATSTPFPPKTTGVGYLDAQPSRTTSHHFTRAPKVSASLLSPAAKGYFFVSGVFATGAFLQRPPLNIEPAFHLQSVRALHSASVLTVLQETAVFSCAETSKVKDESASTTAVAANAVMIVLLTADTP